MKRLRAFAGYIWALLAFPIILATFIGNDFWAGKLVTVTGLKVSPWFTGGEVLRTIEHDQYRTLIHRPVFDGLFRERKKGFLQIDWQAPGGALPELIVEKIDYDRDGIADLQVELDTVNNRAKLAANSPEVIGVERVYDFGADRAIRVLLQNKKIQGGVSHESNPD